MDEDDRESNASSENEQDETMEDADEIEQDNDGEEEDNEEEEDEEPEPEEPEPEQFGVSQQDPAASNPDAPVTDKPSAAEDVTTTVDIKPEPRTSATPSHATPAPTPRWRPTIRPEALTAKTYDIVPTMAAPMATSINALTVTPDMRYWLTGGSDGYIRKYDGVGTINGKQLLTVAQRHPFVDSVVKAGILMSYWENEEPAPPNARVDEHVLSPVYSLAVHSQALWLLSGLESGGINLHSVRIDEGKRITCLQRHSNAVSVLQLAPDEKSALSGSWDKNIFDWDLNNGQVMRQFDGSGGQISALEPRPASGAPFPPEAGEEPIKSETMSGNGARPLPNGLFVNGGLGDVNGGRVGAGGDGGADGQGSPAHESLFGSPAGSLFGDTDNIAGGGFGGDEDDEFSRAMEMTLHDEHGQNGMGHSGDISMQDLDLQQAPAFDPEGAPPPAVQPLTTSATLPNGDATMVNGSYAPETAATSAVATMEQPTAQPLLSSVPDQQFPQVHQPSGMSDFPQASHPSAVQQAAPPSPTLVFSSAPPAPQHDPTQTSASTFFSASIDGTIRIWDRRIAAPIARIGNRPGVPPWCMGACWSPDGNWIYAGRRNGTVEEFSVHRARSGWAPERVLKFPAGSGAVSCVRPMVNGRHLVCASYDILRLYDLRDTSAFKHSSVPFLIIPGPPRAGVISSLYIDPTSRFMLSTAGTRGWEGSCTEVLIGYEISVS